MTRSKFSILPILTLPIVLIPTHSQPFSQCDLSEYYSSLLDVSNRDEMHALIKLTHRASVPYTSSRERDVWDALMALDSDDMGENIDLIYGDASVSLLPHDSGSCSHWNREHIWPRSRGVGESGYDNTDLHHLRPVDCNVNSARGNRLFGACGTGAPSSECTVPAHPEAAADTQKDSVSFLPPLDRRGDVARSILYMALRYDGEENGVENLIVSDCPESVANGAAMGYLSQLLQWHMDDPPDWREQERNYAICRDWQGNRNPFIDYPGLATAYHGLPRSILGDGLGYDCNAPPIPAAPSPLTVTPTKSPSTVLPPSSMRPPSVVDPPSMVDPPSLEGVNDGNAAKESCLGMNQGDVAIIGMKSTNPDQIALVALADLPGGAGLYITDNAWTGTDLKSNEGVDKMTIPPNGITAGTIFGYDANSNPTLQHANLWSKESGDLALSQNGDNVLLYCWNGDEYRFLYAAIYQRDWSPSNADPGAFSSNESALPIKLGVNGANGVVSAVSLAQQTNNWWYVGSREGTSAELLNEISNANHWSSDDASYELATMPNFSLRASSGGCFHEVALIHLIIFIILSFAFTQIL